MGKRNNKNHGKRKPVTSQASPTSDKGTAVQRTHKDTLFRFIFRDKEKLLQLYNALNQSDYRDADGLAVTTLENVVYLGYKNDISFLVDMNLYLVEHQGSWNGNMPLRGVLYFARLYREYVEKKGYDIYGSKTVPLPVPRYVVFYNGKQERPEREIQRLSDSFTPKQDEKEKPEGESPFLPPPALECEVLILNINYGKNREFLEGCRPLLEYSMFIHRIREKIREGHKAEEAVELATDECIAEGILADILRVHRKEVSAMFLEDYDAELHERTLRREGFEDGMEAGEKRINTLNRLLVEDGRHEELIRSILDERLRKKLLEEYGL